MNMQSWQRTRFPVTSETGFEQWVLDSGVSGLRVVVFGGTHGDETEGVLAASRLAGSELALQRGTLTVVPIVHEAAYLADSRTSPLDGRDLARTFPGDAAGAPTQILAHLLHTKVLTGADLLIDLHTAGQALDIPFTAGYIDDGRDARGLAARAAEAFGAEFIWRHPERPPGRTISGMDAAIYTEYPAPGPIDVACVDRFYDGVRRVLAALEMIPEQGTQPGPSIRVVSGGNVDRDLQPAAQAGLFVPRVHYGEQVSEGQLLGQIIDHRGTVVQELRAMAEGWVIVVRRRPRVNPGDQVISVAVTDHASRGAA
jgi:predicted deacylase